MIWGAGGNREKKFRRPFSRKKIFKRPSPGKNKYQKAKNKSIFDFFSAPPQFINGQPLSTTRKVVCYTDQIFPVGTISQNLPNSYYIIHK